jgi:hypothetical protein
VRMGDCTHNARQGRPQQQGFQVGPKAGKRAPAAGGWAPRYVAAPAPYSRGESATPLSLPLPPPPPPAAASLAALSAAAAGGAAGAGRQPLSAAREGM